MRNSTYTAIPLGLQGLFWSNVTEKAWNQTRLTGLNIGDGQHTTPTLSRK